MKFTDLSEFRERVQACTQCRLTESRYKVVMGRGTFPAKILFVGEAPGQTEDNQGEAFCGSAGEILDNALDFGGFRRIVNLKEDDPTTKTVNVNLPPTIPFYIDNMVRCRPPENRKPQTDEINACWPWLEELLFTMSPKVIIPMGDTAVQGLARKLGFKKQIGTKKITELVGRVIVLDNGTVLVPAFHPAYIARRRDMLSDYMRFFSFLSQSYPNWIKVKGKISA